MKRRNYLAWRLLRALTRTGLVLLVSASGCAPQRVLVDYREPLPILHAIPTIQPCRPHEESPWTDCVLVLEEDWYAVLTALKAQCLALGNAPGDCGTDE